MNIMTLERINIRIPFRQEFQVGNHRFSDPRLKIEKKTREKFFARPSILIHDYKSSFRELQPEQLMFGEPVLPQVVHMVLLEHILHILRIIQAQLLEPHSTRK